MILFRVTVWLFNKALVFLSSWRREVFYPAIIVVRHYVWLLLRNRAIVFDHLHK